MEIKQELNRITKCKKLEDRGFKCRTSGANGSDQWHGIGLLSN